MGGPLILNLGCGTKTSPRCVNIDNSPLLRLKKNPWLRVVATPFLSQAQRQRLSQFPDGIVLHDLRHGVPAATGSADAVYHCHLLEHLERWEAPPLFAEIHRVLKPGGIHRIAVPDLEKKVRRYLQHLLVCQGKPAEAATHDRYVASLYEQSVRRDAASTQGMGPWRRRLSNCAFGDARRRRETHQWMYDRTNLGHLLAQSGFVEVEVRACGDSAIPGWSELGLELNERGGEYKPSSFYIEARRP